MISFSILLIATYVIANTLFNVLISSRKSTGNLQIFDLIAVVLYEMYACPQHHYLNTIMTIYIHAFLIIMYNTINKELYRSRILEIQLSSEFISLRFGWNINMLSHEQRGKYKT